MAIKINYTTQEYTPDNRIILRMYVKGELFSVGVFDMDPRIVALINKQAANDEHIDGDDNENN